MANASTLNMPGNDVFISYSRKDQPFVRTLDAAFRKLNQNPWVDWDDIQKGEEWWAAIQKGIEGASLFVFVISPDSIASAVCQDEINYAAQHNKRFLPIVRREGFDHKRVHPRISSHNWLFFRETDDFDTAFQELQKAISTDLDYVRDHTRLLVRAIEWQSKGHNPSYLLRGVDLKEAEEWLTNGANREPQPTDLQTQYVNASAKAEVLKLKAQQKARWTVVLTTVLANLALSIGAGIWFYQSSMNAAVQKVETDMVKALRMGTVGTNGDDFAALANRPTSDGNPPINNPLYLDHQKWLAAVRTVFPDTFVRTYVDGGPGKVRWVGDLSRDMVEGRVKTRFLEPFNAENSERDAFSGKETILMIPYKDELGNWISASGPIRNANGQIVGGMRVDYKESYLIQMRDQVRNTLFIAYLIILIWLLLLSLIILRSLRPIDETH
ncbi:toll/interleukin-1 receptor domain-containing protein [Kovacikia minuta CCNUW1]|uniref:toll/interleukin-1 receptor domain-containing protein n=1 Tax=Kovacikia minuta TaxID=2931930 RepID=UPI001CCAB332|nr:toll/interleukin-1 receptor domain-containing protein [Kovacikia minuta]UBF29151.1 toll/interleukin-1 receptor domain-containing protein [Kovacikia minuta CCNUW1]